MLVNQGNQLPLKVLRGSDASGDVRPGQIVTFVIQLQYLDAAEVSTAATSLLTSAGSIAPLSRGKGLIITDRLESIQRIRQLLAEIDVGPSAERLMKTHSLKHSSGAVVAELINKTFGKSSVPKRLKFNDNMNRLILQEPMYVGERIRDLIYLKESKTILLALETSGSIGIIKNNKD